MPDAPPGFEELHSSPFLDRIGPLFVDRAAENPTFATFVTDRHLNSMGGAHGGFLAAIVDVVAGRATRTVVENLRSLRTVSTTIDYVSGAALGDWLRFAVTIDHAGRRTVFATCRVTRADDLLVARATVILAVAT